MPDISASAKRPRMRSISRVPRCQQRNKSRLRRSSSPPLDRVDPVIVLIPSNAKSPDAVPGGVDIAILSANVSSCSLCKFAIQLIVGSIFWPENRHCERSEAIRNESVDCFVASLLAMTDPNSFVVPAKAGTHNHRRLWLRKVSTNMPNTNGTAYGSLLSH